VTTGKVADVTVAQRLKLPPGTIIVDDPRLQRLRAVRALDREGVYFVTRLKDNAVYRVVRNLPLPQTRRGGVIKIRSSVSRALVPRPNALTSCGW